MEIFSPQLRLQFANANPLGREVQKRIWCFPSLKLVLKYIGLRPFRRSSCKALRSPPKKDVAVVFSCLGKVWKYLVEVILSMICTMTDTSDEKMWSCHFVTAEAFLLCLGKYSIVPWCCLFAVDPGHKMHRVLILFCIQAASLAFTIC